MAEAARKGMMSIRALAGCLAGWARRLMPSATLGPMATPAAQPWPAGRLAVRQSRLSGPNSKPASARTRVSRSSSFGAEMLDNWCDRCVNKGLDIKVWAPDRQHHAKVAPSEANRAVREAKAALTFWPQVEYETMGWA